MNTLKYTVAITGFKNKLGDLNAYSDPDPLKYERISSMEDTTVKMVEIFPYSTFSSLHQISISGYTPVIIEAEVELTPEEYKGLSANGIIYHRFADRKVRAIREISDPWQYAKKIMSVENAKKIGGIRYEMTTWQSKLGFGNDEEFRVYLDLHKEIKEKRHSKFSVTRYNYKWLPRFLEESMDIPIEMYEVYSQRDNNYRIDADSVYAQIRDLPVEKIAKFLSLTSIYEIEKLDKSLHTKELFDHYLKLEAGESIRSIMDNVPDEVLVEYDPDSIFQKMYKNLQALVTESNYQPYDVGDYDYDGESYQRDEREDEVSEIARVLPLLTEKSVPLLRTLVFSFIAPYLSKEVLAVLSADEAPLQGNQLIFISNDGIDITVSMEDGKVASIYSNKYFQATVTDRTASDLSIFHKKMKKDLEERKIYQVYDPEDKW